MEADPPLHTRSRTVLACVLSPDVMRKLADDFKAKAIALNDPLVEAGSFDGVRGIAEVFPTCVFPDALGINEEGREHFLTYGAMVFAGFGPENDYFRNLMKAATVLPWIMAKCRRESLQPGRFRARLIHTSMLFRKFFPPPPPRPETLCD